MTPTEALALCACTIAEQQARLQQAEADQARLAEQLAVAEARVAELADENATLRAHEHHDVPLTH